MFNNGRALWIVHAPKGAACVPTESRKVRFNRSPLARKVRQKAGTIHKARRAVTATVAESATVPATEADYCGRMQLAKANQQIPSRRRSAAPASRSRKADSESPNLPKQAAVSRTSQQKQKSRFRTRPSSSSPRICLSPSPPHKISRSFAASSSESNGF